MQTVQNQKPTETLYHQAQPAINNIAKKSPASRNSRAFLKSKLVVFFEGKLVVIGGFEPPTSAL
jgi:hypothetical protein